MTLTFRELLALTVVSKMQVSHLGFGRAYLRGGKAYSPQAKKAVMLCAESLKNCYSGCFISLLTVSFSQSFLYLLTHFCTDVIAFLFL